MEKSETKHRKQRTHDGRTVPIAPIWKGSICVGLVNVPVKLRSMVFDKSIRFKQLHRKDGGVIRYKRICHDCNEEVEFSDIVKGYEVHKGEYVVITPEELRDLSTESNAKIVLAKFVDYASIDPIYWEKAYMLVPDNSGEQYRLLYAAMEKVDKVGIGQITIRSKERPVLVQPYNGGLVLITLRYNDEILNPMAFEEIATIQHIEPKKEDLDLAVKVIVAYTGRFDPEEFADTVRERVKGLINEKVEAKA